MRYIVASLFVLFLLSCSSQATDNKNKLIGKWVGDIIIPKTGKYVGKMWLEFTVDGFLFQTTGDGKEKVVSKLSYRISKDQIFYKGNATGNEEFNSNYHFRGDVLVMEVNGEHADYTRVKK